jgi:hypothetical protein
MDKIIAQMIHFIKYIVKPNGEIAQVGDTGIESIRNYSAFLNPFAHLDNELKSLLDSGEFNPISDIELAFPKEGYAVIRNFNNSKLSFGNSLYLFFIAAAHKGRGHKHYDDLSFILSYGGHELLTDPGLYAYKNDQYRSYMVSSSAHNTVLVDGKNFKGWNTTFENFYSDSSYTVICASHRNYPGLEHRRWLTYIQPNIIIIKDELNPYLFGNSSKNESAIHKFEQLFHTSNDISIKDIDRGKEVYFMAPQYKQPVMRILQLFNEPIKSNFYRGNIKPVQGWTTKEYGVLDPADVVGFEKSGSNAVFITAIELNNSFKQENRRTINWSDFHYDKDQNEIDIRCRINSIEKRIALDLKNMKVKYIN